MKRTVNYLLGLVAVAIMFSCSEDADPPIADFGFEAAEDNSYEIHFSSQAQNVNSYMWDFGDGETSTEANPVHTYTNSGDYVVMLTAKGEGGEVVVVKDLYIAASMLELLTGGPDATEGKKWKMSQTITPGLAGAGHITAEFTNELDAGTDNGLGLIGLGEEYDNIYTFYHDGTVDINMVNGKGLVSYMYSAVNGHNIVFDSGLGLTQSEVPNVTGGTWELIENTDLVLDTYYEEEGIHETITFPNADYLSLSDGGYLGLLCFTTKTLIRQISKDRMAVTFFMHGSAENPTKPTHMFSISFDAID